MGTEAVHCGSPVHCGSWVGGWIHQKKHICGANLDPIVHIDLCTAGAAYTYYKSLSQEESLERRGKLNNRKVVRRRRERIVRVSSTICMSGGEGKGVKWEVGKNETRGG